MGQLQFLSPLDSDLEAMAVAILEWTQDDIHEARKAILALRPFVEARRIAGLREAAEVADAPLTMAELKLADNHCDWPGFRHAFNAVMKRRKAAILALAEGKEG